MPSSAEPKSIQICQDDKFLSKLLSRDKNIGSSGRVYYTGASGSVPFAWEIRPGAPRKLEVSLLPDAPLTPPRAHHGPNSQSSASKSRRVKSTKGSSSDSSKSSEFLDSFSSSFSGKRSRNASYSGSSADEKAENAEEELVVSCKCSVLTSPMTVTCFGAKKWSRGRRGGAVDAKANAAKRG